MPLAVKRLILLRLRLRAVAIVLMDTLLQRILGADKRTRLLRKNIACSFLIKGVSGLAILALVPVTLACLGEYDNGVWLTVSSLLIWIDNLDIGLGNGLRNRLAECVAGGRWPEARRAVSSTVAMLALVVVPAFVLIAAVLQTADLYSLLNVDPARTRQLAAAATVAALFVSATFVFKFIGNVWLGLQMPAVSNLLVCGGQVLTLLATLGLYLTGTGTLVTVAAAATCPPLLVYVAAWRYTFGTRYPQLRPSVRLFDREMIRQLFGVGVRFFVIQIASALLLMSSNILISKLFSPAHVTPYQIVYRYFTVLLLAFQIVSVPYWSATTDAYRRGDMEWIRSAARQMGRIVAAVAVAAAVMTAVSPLVYGWWLGGMVAIPLRLTALMAVYMTVLTASMAYSNFLNGMGLLRLQLVMTVGAAVAFVPLAVGAVRLWADVSALVVVFIAVQAPTLAVNAAQFTRVLRGRATGVWAS